MVISEAIPHRDILVAPDGTLTPDTLASFTRAFAADRTNRVLQNAVTQVSVDDIALNREILTHTDHTFSCQLDDWAVTNQKKSGRCWLFAGLNLVRPGAMATMGLKEFEFSQNYLLFWHKLERANYVFEAIIETARRPVDDRTIAFLLADPLPDGGQWNMFVGLIKKYGLTPQAVMPETESSSNTERMNAVLAAIVRQGAQRLRGLCAEGADRAAVRAAKEEALRTVHRVLCVHLGTPPERFTWQWRDAEKGFHRTEELTPRQFAATVVTLPLDDYVCLVHDPRRSSPLGRTFAVEYLGNIVGGAPVTYLNVEIAVMKELTRRALLEGEPVWFGCDVGKQMRRDLGLWDTRLFEYDAVYQTAFTLDKAARLEYHETQMTHAMLFTGVDVVDEGVRRWRVENSWGAETGQKGFYTMNDAWYDEYLFEIAARHSALPPELRAALDAEPLILPAWDPMGALAR